MNKSQQETVTLLLLALGILYAHKKGIINLNDIVNSVKGIFGSTTPTTPGGGGGTVGGGSPPAGEVLYDSNNGWSNVRTAASGNPQFTEEAGGIGRLSVDAGSHGRIYIDVPNYNAVMTGEWMFEKGFVGNDNLSLRGRTKHGDCGSSGNVFGGFGSAIHFDKEVEFETEICHNDHENKIKGTLPFTPEMNKWYAFRYYYVDSADKSSVKFKLEIDSGSGYQTVLTGSHDSPAAEYLDEPLFLQESAIWLRINNASEAASIAFKNFKVIAQEAGSLDAEVGGSTSARASINTYLANEYIYGLKVSI